MPVLDGIEAADASVGGPGTENVNMLIDAADHPASVSPGLTPGGTTRSAAPTGGGNDENQNSRCQITRITPIVPTS